MRRSRNGRTTPPRACAPVLVVLASACASDSTGLPPLPDPTYGGGDFLQIIDYQDLDRGYTVHVPPSARADTPAPVLMILHGSGQDGPGVRSLADIETLTDELGWIVLYPGGVEFSWAVGTSTPADLRGVDDVGFIRRMLDRVGGTLNIDGERVFAVGLSNGALMTHRLACQLSGRVRGIASIAGTMLADLAATCAPTRPVRAVFFHGDEDTFFPWEGFTAGDGTELMSVTATAEWWAAENACGLGSTHALPDTAADGTTVELTEYPGCQGGAAVALYGVLGGGHTWPGRGGIGRTTQDIEANVELLTFFGADLP